MPLAHVLRKGKEFGGAAGTFLSLGESGHKIEDLAEG